MQAACRAWAVASCAGLGLLDAVEEEGVCGGRKGEMSIVGRVAGGISGG